MLRDLINFIKPPAEWSVIVIILIGILTGLAAYIIHISKASSYLSSDPKTCINCHVMVPEYSSWRRSSHGRITTCVDCHVPHDNIVNTYHFKAKDGLRHATIFTLRQEPQVMKIKEDGAAAVLKNCIRCHTHTLQGTELHNGTYENYLNGDEKLCWECHREVPHGRVRSLSSTPYFHTPNDEPVIPAWLQKFILVFSQSSKEEAHEVDH